MAWWHWVLIVIGVLVAAGVGYFAGRPRDGGGYFGGPDSRDIGCAAVIILGAVAVICVLALAGWLR